MKSEMLRYIAMNTRTRCSLRTTTGKVAKDLGISQQSVSRILKELEDEKKIHRETFHDGILICIKTDGLCCLEREYEILKEIMEGRNKIRGKIFKGYGQGAYYMKKYQKKIKDKIGFIPYLGTLNVKVDPDEAGSFIGSMKPIIVEGFKTKDRTYGTIKLYRVIVEGIEGAIVAPERSSHGHDVLEIIGPSSFRSGLSKDEGDTIEISKFRNK